MGGPSSYQPHLPVADRSALDQIQESRELDWFHSIDIGGFVTPGLPYSVNWAFVAAFLNRHRDTIRASEVLEPGCADGLWTCWLTKLGARHIDATDIENRQQFRLVTQAFALPATYFPAILSTTLPKTIQRSYDLVASLGLLYHVHDPLMTLIMYVRYLRDKGTLLLETGAIHADEAYLHYTGRGEIYGKEGGNQFIPTVGFLVGALGELGMTVEDQVFRDDGLRDQLGKPVGRVIIAARKTGGVGVHHYAMLLDQLGMLGPEFPKQQWYNCII
jgi:SAM-dependent methyltransferase